MTPAPATKWVTPAKVEKYALVRISMNALAIVHKYRTANPLPSGKLMSMKSAASELIARATK